MHHHGDTIPAILAGTVLDTLPMLPLLFLLYAAMEYLSHSRGVDLVARSGLSGPLGPLVGTALGLLPQCGMSVFVTSLFVTGRVSVGTIVATYLATSDEALPVLIAHLDQWPAVGGMIAAKAIVGIAAGYGLDLALHRKVYTPLRAAPSSRFAVEIRTELTRAPIREVLVHSLRRTVRIWLWVVGIAAVLGIALALLNLPGRLTVFWDHPALAVGATALFGLIPHCAASIAIAEGLVHGVIPFGAALAGLAAGAGYGPIVLVKDGDLRTAFSLLGVCIVLAMGLGFLWLLIAPLIGF
jgi:hypothetical protein